MVLEPKDGPAMLCLSGVLESLPPQCGNTPITNWDWDRVEGEQTAGGSTWGNYQVVGTYDGESFTVQDVGSPGAPANDPSDEIEIPCPEPAGGWVASDPSRMSEGDLQAAGQLAEGQADSSGWWIKHTRQPSEQGPDTLDDVVMNAAFTGDIERHSQELNELWGGPLCVVKYDRTEAELHRIQNELTDNGHRDFGLDVLFSSTDIVHNEVEIGVVVADDQTRAAIDSRYGQGTVRLVPALHPVG